MNESDKKVIEFINSIIEFADIEDELGNIYDIEIKFLELFTAHIILNDHVKQLFNLQTFNTFIEYNNYTYKKNDADFIYRFYKFIVKKYSQYKNNVSSYIISRFHTLAGVMFACAHTYNIELRWGGDWDGDGTSLDQNFDDLAHFETKRDKDLLV